MTARVTIADARWLAGRTVNQQPQFEGATVWYFGESHELYLALRRALPVDTRWGNVGQRMNAISEANQRALIDMEQCFHIDDVSWWECRNMAERGPYSSSFTADCCRYLLFCELLSEDEAHVFVVEAPGLGDLLAEIARKYGTGLSRLGPRQLSRWANAFGRRACDVAGYIRATWRRWRQVRRLARLRSSNPIPIDDLRECDVLFAAWTMAHDFPKDGRRGFAHSMGYLPKLFRERGLKVGFIALPLDEVSDPKAIASNVVSSDEAAILPDDTVSTRGLITTCLRSLVTRAVPSSTANIGGQAVDGITRLILAREQFDWRAANAALWSRVGPFLASHGSRPMAIFHVYENQTWEKGLRQGIRQALPECKIIGCMQSPLSKLYLNMLPAASEQPPERWPDAVLCHGALSVRQLIDAGATSLSVINAGLFRQGAFLCDRQEPAMRNNRRRIVCATGPGYQECLELAHKSAEAVRGRADLVLIINFHPITTDRFRDGIRNFLHDCGAMNNNVQFSDQPVKDLLGKGIDAVLYADTNSGFEGVSSGARAINILRDHALSFDKLPDGLARRVRTVEEIRRALDELGNDKKWPSEEFINSTLADCFSEIDLDAILTTAGLNQAKTSSRELKPGEIKAP